VVKIRDLTAKQILSVPCPTCGAATDEACELHTGAPRYEPHRDRKFSAAEAIENDGHGEIRSSRTVDLIMGQF
jgi:hypothetical protein